jgi:hypothetical protein
LYFGHHMITSNYHWLWSTGIGYVLLWFVHLVSLPPRQSSNVPTHMLFRLDTLLTMSNVNCSLKLSNQCVLILRGCI